MKKGRVASIVSKGAWASGVGAAKWESGQGELRPFIPAPCTDTLPLSHTIHTHVLPCQAIQAAPSLKPRKSGRHARTFSSASFSIQGSVLGPQGLERPNPGPPSSPPPSPHTHSHLTFSSASFSILRIASASSRFLRSSSSLSASTCGHTYMSVRACVARHGMI